MKQRIILLADDDADDRDFFCEALSEIDERIECNCSVNGQELLRKLMALDDLPELIFLDLNMPVVNGVECLKLLKTNPVYKAIPVIIISTSSHRQDRDLVERLGAVSYFVKPMDYKDLKKSLQAIVLKSETDRVTSSFIKAN